MKFRLLLLLIFAFFESKAGGSESGDSNHGSNKSDENVKNKIIEAIINCKFEDKEEDLKKLNENQLRAIFLNHNIKKGQAKNEPFRLFSHFLTTQELANSRGYTDTDAYLNLNTFREIFEALNEDSKKTLINKNPAINFDTFDTFVKSVAKIEIKDKHNQFNLIGKIFLLNEISKSDISKETFLELLSSINTEDIDNIISIDKNKDKLKEIIAEVKNSPAAPAAAPPLTVSDNTDSDNTDSAETLSASVTNTREESPAVSNNTAVTDPATVVAPPLTVSDNTDSAETLTASVTNTNETSPPVTSEVENYTITNIGYFEIDVLTVNEFCNFFANIFDNKVKNFGKDTIISFEASISDLFKSSKTKRSYGINFSQNVKIKFINLIGIGFNNNFEFLLNLNFKNLIISDNLIPINLCITIPAKTPTNPKVAINITFSFSDSCRIKVGRCW